jgi:hypothetical protein
MAQSIRKRPTAGRTQAYVPFSEADHKALRDYCQREGRKKGWVIQRAVREYLERQTSLAGPPKEESRG